MVKDMMNWSGNYMKTVIYNPYLESQLNDSNYKSSISTGLFDSNISEIYVSNKKYFDYAIFISKQHNLNVEFYSQPYNNSNVMNKIFVDELGFIINDKDIPDFGFINELTEWRMSKL